MKHNASVSHTICHLYVLSFYTCRATMSHSLCKGKVTHYIAWYVRSDQGDTITTKNLIFYYCHVGHFKRICFHTKYLAYFCQHKKRKIFVKCMSFHRVYKSVLRLSKKDELKWELTDTLKWLIVNISNQYFYDMKGKLQRCVSHSKYCCLLHRRSYT